MGTNSYLIVDTTPTPGTSIYNYAFTPLPITNIIKTK